LSKA